MTYFKQYNKNQTIFKNIKYLNPECIPTEFHYRDNELATIASYIAPLIYGGIPNHAVIIGGNATGKTTAIQKLFQEIEETITDCIPCYINCRKHDTEYKVYGQIYTTVTGKKAPQIGSSSQKLYTTVMKQLEHDHKALIIALDDANYLLGSENEASPHSQNIIRNLTRANESYHVNIGIYPVITSQEFKYKFELEVSTLFTPREVYFKEYSEEQYYNIIKERCDVAFNIKIEETVIKKIVKTVQKTRNIRIAWDILREFGIKMNISQEKQEKIIEEILGEFL